MAGWIYPVFRISWASLPYLSYVCFPGLLAVLGVLGWQRRLAVLPWMARGLGLVAGLMVLGCLTASDRPEAFLQLANFLPLFLFFALVPSLFYPLQRLEQLALDMVWMAVPVNLYAVVQFWAKMPDLPEAVQAIPIIAWMRDTPHKERALTVFDHPNTLASYLVIVLGLGLGLILQRSMSAPAAPVTGQSVTSQGRSPLHQVPIWALYGATYANGVGIFCSGSRNGVLIAVAQIVVASLLVKLNRRMVWLGLAGLGGMGLSILGLGLGGRSLSLGIFTNDPRLGVWRVALALVQERPWLGWGLGSFKLLYPDRRLPTDQVQIFHAHNLWLLLAAEAGIIVMVLLTAIVGYVYGRSLLKLLQQGLGRSSNARTDSLSGVWLGYLLAFGGCTVFSLFDVAFYDIRVNLINWFTLAGLYAFAHARPTSKAIAEPTP